MTEGGAVQSVCVAAVLCTHEIFVVVAAFSDF